MFHAALSLLITSPDRQTHINFSLHTTLHQEVINLQGGKPEVPGCYL